MLWKTLRLSLQDGEDKHKGSDEAAEARSETQKRSTEPSQQAQQAQRAQQLKPPPQQAQREPVPTQYSQQAPELHGLAGGLPKRPILGVSEDLSGGALVRKVSS